MLNHDVVFVLGAGFSAELGLPLGKDLRQHIHGLLPMSERDGGGDRLLRELIESKGNPNWARAAVLLRQALQYGSSIDSLVEHHKNDRPFVDVAKWAIARAIGTAEMTSPLGAKPRRAGPATIADVFKLPPECAYHDLFRLIVGGGGRPTVGAGFQPIEGCHLQL